MKHNLIKTDNYLLVVDDSEIKEGDWYKTPLGIYSQFNGTEKLLIGTRRVASHAPLNGAPILEGVNLLPLLDEEIPKLSLSEEEINQLTFDGKSFISHAHVYHRVGYNKAREKYKWTNEDVIRIIEKSRETGLTAEYLMLSLQHHPKHPIAFECEIEPKFKHIGSTKEVKGSGSRIKNNYAGNPKTFINSEGRIEWVGKYIYE